MGENHLGKGIRTLRPVREGKVVGVSVRDTMEVQCLVSYFKDSGFRRGLGSHWKVWIRRWYDLTYTLKKSHSHCSFKNRLKGKQSGG